MKWNDHLNNIRGNLYTPGPENGSFAISIPPQRMELRMTEEQVSRVGLVADIATIPAHFYVPCNADRPLPVEALPIDLHKIAA